MEGTNTISLLHSVHSDDDSRVCLSELPGVVGSDYINASFITVRIIITILGVINHHLLMLICRDMLVKIAIFLPKVSKIQFNILYYNILYILQVQ